MSIDLKELAQLHFIMISHTKGAVRVYYPSAAESAVDRWLNACEEYRKQIEASRFHFYETEAGGLLFDIFWKANQQRKPPRPINLV